MREIKFRAWDKDNKKMLEVKSIHFMESDPCIVVNPMEFISLKHVVLMQYTGLKDKNGIEIYEYNELDGAYEVIFKDLKYNLRHISNNDIIGLQDYWRDKNGEIEVTREYTKV